MADYSKKANDFEQSLKKGVPKNAAQKGLADYKAKAKMASQSKPASNHGEQRVRSRGGITRD